jgi:ankyrin repeat protein
MPHSTSLFSRNSISTPYLDADGNTALHLAALQKPIAEVNRLLEAGNSVDPQNKNKYTPLHLAAMNGRTAVCQLLLSYGADIKAETHHAETPEELARDIGHDECANMLKELEEDSYTPN